ncbi:TPA: hypothetical protein ACU93F_001632 [Legionella pneumophila]|nr:hypothetical protein [Legionella pneumophila]
MKFKELMAQLKNGNTISDHANEVGRKNWSEAVKAANFPPSNLRKEFLKKGYISLGNSILPSELIKELQEEFRAVIQDDVHSTYSFDDPILLNAYNHGGYKGEVDKFRRDIIDCAKSLPSTSKIWANETFRNVIEELIGSPFQEDGMAAWRINHVPEHIYEKFEATTNRFHFDSQYVDRVKIFIFLTDVTLENGPFQHFSRRYSRYLILRGFREEKRRISITSGLPKNIINSPRLKKHTGPAGHILVCATSFCIHRAGEVMPGHHRDMLQLCVRPRVISSNETPEKSDVRML